MTDDVRDHQNAFIGGEAFDGDYCLEDLLPADAMDAILAGSAAIVPLMTAVMNEAGRIVHTSHTDWPGTLLDGLAFEFSLERMQAAIVAATDKSTCVFPLIHELETIGYLVAKPAGKIDEGAKNGNIAGAYLQSLCQETIRCNAQVLMTSRLHGETVEDSFRELQAQALQLAASEKKYRELAASLEIEVTRQTEEIRTAQANLMQQEKLAAVGRLAAGMAHEINNPLGFIVSNLNTLADYCRDHQRMDAALQSLIHRNSNSSEDDVSSARHENGLCGLWELHQELDLDFILQDAVHLIEESLEGAARIQSIVANLKTFAQPGVMDVEPVDINQSLAITVDIVAAQLGGDLPVETTFAELPRISCRRHEMNQAFMNILINARQAAGKAGQIAVRTSEDGPNVRIDISDNGPGISPGHRDRVFDPFFTTRDVGQGCGLGLTFARQVIRAHQGDITVAERRGGGTTVTIQLPL